MNEAVEGDLTRSVEKRSLTRSASVGLLLTAERRKLPAFFDFQGHGQLESTLKRVMTSAGGPCVAARRPARPAEYGKP